MLFKKRGAGTAGAASVQTASAAGHPFGEIGRYVPLGGVQARLYDALREAVPLIDAAIFKLIRLTGGFTVECRDKKGQAGLEHFLGNVPVGGSRMGVHAFLSTYFEQLLTYGTAVGELVAAPSGRIAALYNAPLAGLTLRQGKTPLDVQICRCEGAQPVPVGHPERIVFSVLNPGAGEVMGNSLLKGLPFVSGVLLKIYQTVGVNWERVGNVRFAVTYKPQNDAMDRSLAKERAVQIAKEWGETMQGGGPVRDFVAVGDVGIRVIGADSQIPDSEIPVRQMLEQIVAKTGIPPFLFGLSWSSTERMSAQQADVLTSELEAYRRILTPVIVKICEAWLLWEGFDPAVTVKWDDITLLDEVERARARLYHAQADALTGTKKEGGQADEQGT